MGHQRELASLFIGGENADCIAARIVNAANIAVGDVNIAACKDGVGSWEEDLSSGEGGICRYVRGYDGKGGYRVGGTVGRGGNFL